MTRVISSVPLIGKAWDRFSHQAWVRHSIDECKLKLLYRSLRPSKIPMSQSGATLFVNRLEPRGRRVLLGGATGQAPLKQLWQSAVTTLQPEIVIDVGLNYGEFLFASRYESARCVIGIEANPLLEPWLTQSLATHPERDKIQIKMALASDSSNESRDFFVDASSSGRSSVVCRDPETCQLEEVETVAIDDMIENVGHDDSPVVFKIDVEGYEPSVLAGMIRTRERRRRIFGVLEFNNGLIRKAGFDPDHFLSDLSKSFHLWAIPHNQPAQRLNHATQAELRDLLKSDEIELDIAVMSDHTAEHASPILGVLDN